MLHNRSLLLFYFICNSVYVNPQFSMYRSSTFFPSLPSFLPPSLPCSFIFLFSQGIHGVSFYSVDYTLLLRWLVLMLTLSQMWQVGSPFDLVVMSFRHVSIILWALSCLLAPRDAPHSCGTFFTQLWPQSFLQDTLSPLGNGWYL